jgi:hypothetical protein
MNKVSADKKLPPREHDNTKLMKYIQRVNDLGCSYVIKVGDYIMYGEKSVEECHRLGEVTAEEDIDDVKYLQVKFQTVGAKRFVFDLDPVRVHKVLAVPLDEYKLHDGKRFHYFGPPPRCYSSHKLYLATKCVMMSDFPSPEATMEIYKKANLALIFCIHHIIKAYLVQVGHTSLFKDPQAPFHQNLNIRTYPFIIGNKLKINSILLIK